MFYSMMMVKRNIPGIHLLKILTLKEKYYLMKEILKLLFLNKKEEKVTKKRMGIKMILLLYKLIN